MTWTVQGEAIKLTKRLKKMNFYGNPQQKKKKINKAYHFTAANKMDQRRLLNLFSKTAKNLPYRWQFIQCGLIQIPYIWKTHWFYTRFQNSRMTGSPFTGSIFAKKKFQKSEGSNAADVRSKDKPSIVIQICCSVHASLFLRLDFFRIISPYSKLSS